MATDRNCIVLCSGGLDSATVMAIVKNEGYNIYSLSFNYGQRHKIELAAAGKISSVFNARQHLVINMDLDKIGGSALTADIDVPKGVQEQNTSDQIPVTYVPARNTIFLSYALAWAEVTGARDVFIGVNAVDYSGYPDCRPEYIKAFQAMARLATKAGTDGVKTRIMTPLIRMTKAEIIQKGTALGLDYSITHSCYDPMPDGTSCGNCDSCILRKKGFREAGIKDPAKYAST